MILEMRNLSTLKRSNIPQTDKKKLFSSEIASKLHKQTQSKQHEI